MLLPAQLRAARALLGWSREDLAERSGIGAGTIKDFEVEKSDPKQGTVHRWRRALEAEGVEFTDQTDTVGPGVRFRKPVAEAK
jgi:transcriptional regulator with XRE-family HTH domain